ncbi:MAG: homocysteine S-methyltransferase family protein [Chloroflexi bacterium]|nr:homocysteine S-methyltransferase family protein [Chloroflexota bacterium]
MAPLGRVSEAQAEAAFAEQIEALLNPDGPGVDLLILETMTDVKEMKTAVSAAARPFPRYSYCLSAHV